jgi:hypothetical protein
VVDDGYEFLRQWPACCDDGGEEDGASFGVHRGRPGSRAAVRSCPVELAAAGPNRSGAWRGRGRGPDLPGYLNPR